LVTPTVIRYLRALAIIQDHTSIPVRIPEVSTVSFEDAQAVMFASAIIEGHTLVRSWRVLNFQPDAEQEIDSEGNYELSVLEELSVTVGPDRINLGVSEKKLLSARLEILDDASVQAAPKLNNTLHCIFAPSESGPTDGRNRVRWRLVPSNSELTDETS
jgi:hypothetical protein